MQPLTFITLSRNSQFSQELKDALAENARTRLLADCNKLDQMLAEVMRLRPSAAVVVLEPDRAVKEFAFIKQLAAACPSTAVVAAAIVLVWSYSIKRPVAGFPQLVSIQELPEMGDMCYWEPIKLDHAPQVTSGETNLFAAFDETAAFAASSG